MEDYVGLDVSMKETAVSIRRVGQRVWRGKCVSDPTSITALIRERAPAATRVVFETGPLSVWFYHALRAEGIPAICIDARHAKAALDMAANKTDANDADGLAHLAEVGFFREVRAKSFDSMLTRTLVGTRIRLVRIATELSNQIRGILKTFGLLVPSGKGGAFEKNVRALLAGQAQLDAIVLPMLEVWGSIRRRAAELGRRLMAAARQDQACNLHVDPRHRRDHRNGVRNRHRGSRQLQEIKVCRSLGRVDHPPIPIRRSRLRRAYIPSRRPASARFALRGCGDDPDARVQ
jgi:transposase